MTNIRAKVDRVLIDNDKIIRSYEILYLSVQGKSVRFILWKIGKADFMTDFKKGGDSPFVCTNGESPPPL